MVGKKGVVNFNNITCGEIFLSCSEVWGLLDKHDDLRASHELLNTETIL